MSKAESTAQLGAPVNENGPKDYGAPMPAATERFNDEAVAANGYRDPVFAVLFLLFLVAMPIGAVVMFVKNKVNLSTTTNGDDVEAGSIVGFVFALLAAATLIPFAYLQLLQRFALSIIWVSIVSSIVLQAVGGVVLLVVGDGKYTGTAIFLFVMAVRSCEC
jgi:hypothetical protein